MADKLLLDNGTDLFLLDNGTDNLLLQGNTTVYRVTQQVAEAIMVIDAIAVRASQLLAETIMDVASSARVSQLAVEVIMITKRDPKLILPKMGDPEVVCG